MTRLLFSLMMTTLCAAPAFAANDAQTAEARKVIEQQLSALARDDADEAYSYAAPGIQAAFPSSLQFLAMVATKYPVVYRHKSVEFGDAVESEGHVAEDVVFTDDDGKVWQAIYKLERGGDGQWLITGCVLAEVAEQNL